MIERYLTTFSVDRTDMEKLVSTALSGGGDWCDLYFENTVFNNLLLRDGEVTSGGFHVDFGVGIRVLCGQKTGYAYSESTAMGDMLSAAKAASMIALGVGAGGVALAGVGANTGTGGTLGRASIGSGAGGRRNGGTMTEGTMLNSSASGGNFYPCKRTWAETDHEEFLPFLGKLESLVRSKDSRIVKVSVKLSDSQSDVMMFNSLGELTADSRPLCSVIVSAVFSQNGRTESKSASRSFRMGTEMITDSLAAELADEVVKGIDERFEARRPKGGKMPVVMGAGASGILLHEAMGHAFEADFNRKGQSIFSDRMGRRICSDKINIVDDATLPHSRGSLNYDDEGVSGQKTYMVKDGVLNSYLHDRISAGFYGVAPTGNGRRESFRFNPIPRMRTTYMEAGDAAPQDIISSVKRGIYVDEFSNGQVKIGEGDFTFFVKSGFLIENGRLTMPVKDINVIGNGPKALDQITAVGNDLRLDNGTWTCGKEQSVAVSLGIPTVLISSLTVGGEQATKGYED